MEVRKITYEEAKPFILGIHYARRMPCVQYAFGLFDSGIFESDDRLIGVVTYGQPASPYLCTGIAGEENKHKVLELNRLVILPNSPKNSASYLVSHSLKMLPKGLFIVSYADSAWGHVGYVYQATNWLYTGMTKERTDIYSESGHARHHGENKNKRQFRSAKYRYVYLTGNKKEQMKQLNYPIIQEYPKGDSIRYNVSDPHPVDNRAEHKPL